MSDELDCRSVSRHFAGVVAVDNVSLTVKPGEIHGLIGPNGSGKTTMLNLMSGYYAINNGSIALGGADISGTTVQDRARLGLSRTFQAPKLLPDYSVLDNAMLGGWPHAQAGFLETAFSIPRSLREEKSIRARASDILDGIGLGDVKNRRAELLEHTAQRFLEIARALTMMPRFILLDEPAGGLTVREIDKLADIVTTIRESGVGVLIVEHHTDFIFRICDRVTVLNLGKVIAHGPGDSVSRDPEVIRVYLGA